MVKAQWLTSGGSGFPRGFRSHSFSRDIQSIRLNIWVHMENLQTNGGEFLGVFSSMSMPSLS